MTYQHRYIAASQHLMNRQLAKESIVSRAENTYTKIYGSRIRETDKAVYFKIHRVGNPSAPAAFEATEQDTFWFPISQTKSMSTSARVDEEDMIEVADWILSNKGII